MFHMPAAWSLRDGAFWGVPWGRGGVPNLTPPLFLLILLTWATEHEMTERASTHHVQNLTSFGE